MVLWLVRAGRRGEEEQEALAENIITIGWNDLPDLSKVKEKEELKTIYTKTHPDEKKMRLANRMGQVWSFIDRINIGDLVGLPLKTQSLIAIGEVTGNYEYKEESANTKHRRKVEWKKIIPRSEFDQDILYSFGSLLTVGQVKRENAEKRIRDMLNDVDTSRIKHDRPNDDLQSDLTSELDLEQASKDSITKFIERNFMGHDLTRLVDKILISKGYVTYRSPPGPDDGVDILAGSGKLGFDDPKICIQVKSSKSPVDVKVLRELEGVAKNFGADYSILVAWGGLNKRADQEINRSFFTTKLWDQRKIIDELVENYDKLDSELRSEIPLRKMYAIIEDDEE